MDMLMAISATLGYLAAWYYCFVLKKVVIEKTQASNSMVRVAGRSLFSTLCFGVGIVGGEGFGLPGPILLAMVVDIGSNLYLHTVVVPFVLWFVIFAIAHSINFCIDKKDASKSHVSKS